MKKQLIPLILVFMLAISLWPAIGQSQISEGFSFGRYNDYVSIKGELENLTALHPDITDLITIGQTYEGRDIIAIRLTDNPGIEDRKSVV